MPPLPAANIILKGFYKLNVVIIILKHIYNPKKTVNSPWLSISEGCRILSTRQGYIQGKHGLEMACSARSSLFLKGFNIFVLHEALQSSENNTSLRLTVCKTPSAKGFHGGFGTNQGNFAL